MKIQEFRDKIKACKTEDVEKIAAELYKLLPKSKKDEADTIIVDILSGNVSTKLKKSESVPDLDTLKNEVNLFIENVDSNLYYVPNRVIPKSKRSKWRFEVMNFVKTINNIPTDEVNGDETADLLQKLYSRLSYGCGYYIFPSDDPFNSIGIRQPDFYDMMIKRTFANGYDDEKIKKMLEYATTTFLDRNSLHIEMENIFVNMLKTSDLKYKTIEFIKEYVEKYEKELKNEKRYSNSRYRLERNIEEMCATMLIIGIRLFEPEEAIKYYWQHDKETDKEITLYKILNVISCLGEDELWIKAYDYGLIRRVEPRDYLKKKYEKLIMEKE